MKLGSQNRLNIPSSLLDEIGFNYRDGAFKVRLSIKEDHLILFKPSDETMTSMEYHDVISIDEKGRCVISKHIRNLIGANGSTEFIVSALQNQIIIRWK